MKAQELRLGNYVAPAIGINFESARGGYKHYGVGRLAHLPIRAITLDMVTVEAVINGALHLQDVSFGDIVPIPLSEELLLNCGFVEDEETEGYKKDGMRLSHNRTVFDDEDGNLYVINYNEAFGNFAISPPVKYLHQLQNLYFALTGEELDVQF